MDINILSVITTTILALAAILAYLIQRSRYLREIEPDLDLSWLNKVSIGTITDNLKQWWNLTAYIHAINMSNNHARDLNYSYEITIFPKRGASLCITSTHRDTLRLHPRDLLSQRRIKIPVYIGWNLIPGLYNSLQSLEGTINTEDVGFQISINLTYYSQHELILFAMLPFWSFGRKKYQRTVSGSWGFHHNPNQSPYYFYRKWQFPKEELES